MAEVYDAPRKFTRPKEHEITGGLNRELTSSESSSEDEIEEAEPDVKVAAGTLQIDPAPLSNLLF